jgi:hypothetical protein
MIDCEPCSMPIDTQAKVSSDYLPQSSRALQYHTFTKPNISYTVQ